jgi:hypothetical protein
LSVVAPRPRGGCAGRRDRNQQLREQLQQLEERGGDPNRVEIPPHY